MTRLYWHIGDVIRARQERAGWGAKVNRSALKNQLVVEYALRGTSKPMGVADWETHLVDQPPEALERSLPTIAQIDAELARDPISSTSTKRPSGNPTQPKTQMPRKAKPRASRGKTKG